MKYAYKILMEELKGINQFRNLGVERKVFKMGNKKWCVMVRIGPCQGCAFLYQYHFFQQDLIFYRTGGCSRFLRNVGVHVPNNFFNPYAFQFFVH
jgi:hypothetical protein